MVCAPHHAAFCFHPQKRTGATAHSCRLMGSFSSKNQQSPNHTNSLNPSPPGFCLFNLGVALLVYSPFLAGMGTLINLLKKKLLTWETFAHTGARALIWIAYAWRLVFYRRDSVCFWELKEIKLGSRGTN